MGTPGNGLLLGASVFIVMKAFASGGSALTGTEAISNGVSVFRPPESRNARITLVIMSMVLGSLVLGIAALAAIVHPVPYAGHSHGAGPGGPVRLRSRGFPHVLFLLLQAGTMLILVLAANTSFTGFPFLASFAADDSYLPRQLTRRGHRLVFSTGILVLTAVAIVILLITQARLDSLIAALRHRRVHRVHHGGGGHGEVPLHPPRAPLAARRRHQRHRRAAVVRGPPHHSSSTKFEEGAWVVVVLMPLGVLVLTRLHRQYVKEDEQLEAGASQACEVPVLRKHMVVVLVDRMDLATARAIQYARTLSPDHLRAVHFAVDPVEAATLEHDWSRLGLSRLPLDIIDCPDRRLARAALELAAQITRDGDTELTMLLPRRGFAAGWRRLLHDRSADRIAAAVGHLPHVNATIVPFQLSGGWRRRARDEATDPGSPRPSRASVRTAEDFGPLVAGTTPIGEAQWRQRVRVAGRIRSLRVPTAGATANLECTLVDGTGAILLVFQGRRRIPGIQQGARLVAEGMVGAWEGRLAILNPDYELIAGPDTKEVDAGV